MTEEQIERAVERAMDWLDRRYMAGEIDGEAYADACRALDAWATDELSRWFR